MARILLVEDNEMIRDMLSERLERKGFHVYQAIDGAQGIKMAQAQQPDLILLDMSLPVIDGWQAARQLKATAETQAIPIIALTAHAIAGDREKTLAAGCDDYSTKPVDFSQLLGKLQKLLKMERAL
jgi:CheY-like chemotaxis protein